MKRKNIMLFEEFTKNQALLHDILMDQGHPNRPEMDSLLAQIEDPESEEAEMWSEEERKRVDSFLSGIELTGFRETDPAEAKLTAISNSFKVAKSALATQIESMEKTFSDKMYAPRDAAAAEEAKAMMEELEEIQSRMSRMEGWLSDIRKIVEDPAKAAEAASLASLAEEKTKQASAKIYQAKFTYR